MDLIVNILDILYIPPHEIHAPDTFRLHRSREDRWCRRVADLRTYSYAELQERCFRDGDTAFYRLLEHGGAAAHHAVFR